MKPGDHRLLTYEQFVARVARPGGSGALDPRYGNFFLYFVPSAVNTRRLTRQFFEFTHGQQSLEQDLSTAFSAAREKDGISAALPLLEQKLYKAYCFMRPLVQSDDELFA